MTHGIKPRSAVEMTVPLRLPRLDPQQAHALTLLLEAFVREIWHTYGDGIADYLGCVDPDSMNAPPGSVSYWPQVSADEEDDS